MATVDIDVVRHMLQSIEHLVEVTDRVSVAAGQLLQAQQTGKPLAPGVLQHYEQQLAELTTLREQMRTFIARWWTQIEEAH